MSALSTTSPTVYLGSKVTAEQLDAVDALAEKLNVRRSDVVRMAVEVVTDAKALGRWVALELYEAAEAAVMPEATS